jgi:hypothetical protein
MREHPPGADDPMGQLELHYEIEDEVLRGR